jgi:hypothetical protein
VSFFRWLIHVAKLSNQWFVTYFENYAVNEGYVHQMHILGQRSPFRKYVGMG